MRTSLLRRLASAASALALASVGLLGVGTGGLRAGVQTNTWWGGLNAGF